MQYMYVTISPLRTPKLEVPVSCEVINQRSWAAFLLLLTETDVQHLDTSTQIIGTTSGISWYLTNRRMDLGVGETESA